MSLTRSSYACPCPYAIDRVGRRDGAAGTFTGTGTGTRTGKIVLERVARAATSSQGARYAGMNTHNAGRDFVNQPCRSSLTVSRSPTSSSFVAAIFDLLNSSIVYDFWIS